MTTASSTPALGARDLADYQRAWLDVWPDALAIWGHRIMLQSPVFITDDPAPAAGNKKAATSPEVDLAAIGLYDKKVTVNLKNIVKAGLGDHALEVLSHEIGHHVLCPADLTQHGKMLARIAAVMGSSGDPQDVAMLANVWADMLINDRLTRYNDLDMAGVYKAFSQPNPTPFWVLILAAYQRLWSLPDNTLVNNKLITGDIARDSLLLSRVVRAYANDMHTGAGSFTLLCLPYLYDERAQRNSSNSKNGQGAGRLADITAGEGASVPDGLSEVDGEATHPADDPRINPGAGKGKGKGAGEDGDGDGDGETSQGQPGKPGKGRGKGQRLEVFAYGQVLKALGFNGDMHEVAARWYAEQAAPLLIPFPTAVMPRATDPTPEGYDTWETGDDIDTIDWFATMASSPEIIPGVTTRTRVWAEAPGDNVGRAPIRLDLYVDSSGSMPDPATSMSYSALAGTVLALSALRAGASVKVTLWSGSGQYRTTDGFIRNRAKIMEVLVGHIGGGTAFPLHELRDTYTKKVDHTHIVVLSDDGVTTMLEKDEKGTPGATIVANALRNAGAGGTLVLEGSDYGNWSAKLKNLGWNIAFVSTGEALVDFAHKFASTVWAPQTGTIKKGTAS